VQNAVLPIPQPIGDDNTDITFYHSVTVKLLVPQKLLKTANTQYEPSMTDLISAVLATLKALFPSALIILTSAPCCSSASTISYTQNTTDWHHTTFSIQFNSETG